MGMLKVKTAQSQKVFLKLVTCSKILKEVSILNFLSKREKLRIVISFPFFEKKTKLEISSEIELPLSAIVIYVGY